MIRPYPQVFDFQDFVQKKGARRGVGGGGGAGGEAADDGLGGSQGAGRSSNPRGGQGVVNYPPQQQQRRSAVRKQSAAARLSAATALGARRGIAMQPALTSAATNAVNADANAERARLLRDVTQRLADTIGLTAASSKQQSSSSSPSDNRMPPPHFADNSTAEAHAASVKIQSAFRG